MLDGTPAFCIAAAKDEVMLPCAVWFSVFNSSCSISATYFSSSLRVTTYLVPAVGSITILSTLNSSPNGTSTVLTMSIFCPARRLRTSYPASLRLSAA